MIADPATLECHHVIFTFLMHGAFSTILDSFNIERVTISEFILYLLSEPTLQCSPLISDLHSHRSELILALGHEESRLSKSANLPPHSDGAGDLDWAYETIRNQFTEDVQQLLLQEKGWQTHHM